MFQRNTAFILDPSNSVKLQALDYFEMPGNTNPVTLSHPRQLEPSTSESFTDVVHIFCVYCLNSPHCVKPFYVLFYFCFLMYWRACSVQAFNSVSVFLKAVFCLILCNSRLCLRAFALAFFMIVCQPARQLRLFCNLSRANLAVQ
jgi:hypothetical protein